MHLTSIVLLYQLITNILYLHWLGRHFSPLKIYLRQFRRGDIVTVLQKCPFQCISWQKNNSNKRSLSEMFVLQKNKYWLSSQILLSDHTKLKYLYYYQDQKSIISQALLHIDVVPLFICLNASAYISCKGNSLLALTFPVQPR